MLFNRLAVYAAVAVLATVCPPVFAQSPAPVVNSSTTTGASSIVDTLSFGQNSSESAHATTVTLGQVIQGGLGQSARILLPQPTPDWMGGSLAFTMHVDPVKLNYFTVRLWGSDVTNERLILLCEGKQIGYRHLGDVDLLDDGSDSAPLPGRFYYRTCPLPLALTQGKTSVQFEIRSNGQVWGYGQTWQQYQKPLTVPTRGIYTVYTHTDGCFVPPAAEVQGAAPANLPVRATPGPEILDALKTRVNQVLDGELKSKAPISQQELHLLARAYFIKWSDAYQNPLVVTQAIASLDALYAAYNKNPEIAQSEPSMYNAGWFGLGFAGDAVRLLAQPLSPSLDQSIDNGQGGTITRRAAYSAMLCASRDWHIHNRRQYTNQSMITDMNIYTANLGVESVDPSHALPDAQMKDLLYQAVGLEPWLGSEKADNSGPEMPLGSDYWELTPKGLTKELGFVGYYGEVLDWATEIYDSTRPYPGQPGDQKIKGQIEKIARARDVFRYASEDDDGNRAARAETIVGWRDEGHYPGDITYAERPTWDASPLYEPAATLDQESIGAVQQMLADNQLFATLQTAMKENSLRQTAGLLDVPDDYDLIKSLPPSNVHLPMTGPNDFVWSDEEDGVVAVKHGETILYASVYWRARSGINNLARVHCIAPKYDRIAEVYEDEKFVPSGMTFTQPDWTNMGFGGGGLHYNDNVHSAYAGEQLPIASIPTDVQFKPGDESPYAGRADFYELRYGNFVIAMNSTKDKSYTLTSPAGYTAATDLSSGQKLSLTKPVTVAPMSTVVLYL